MKSLMFRVLLAGFFFLSVQWSGAEQAPPSPDQSMESTPVSTSPPTLTYKPPRRGTPASGHRVGGGTRSAGKTAPLVTVLAPDHFGLTAQDQPVLYWFISETVTTPIEVEVTLIEEDGVKPVMKTKLPHPVAPGIQRLDLSQYGVHLNPGARYEWSVALVLDSKRRSRDIIASGGIERIHEAQAPSMPDNHSNTPQAAAAYGEAGLWYDLIMSLSDQIAATPTNEALRQQRADLLETAGLKEASAFDRGK